MHGPACIGDPTGGATADVIPLALGGEASVGGVDVPVSGPHFPESLFSDAFGPRVRTALSSDQCHPPGQASTGSAGDELERVEEFTLEGALTRSDLSVLVPRPSEAAAPLFSIDPEGVGTVSKMLESYSGARGSDGHRRRLIAPVSGSNRTIWICSLDKSSEMVIVDHQLHPRR